MGEIHRKQFTFYDSFYKAVSRIRKKADRADAYDAIIQYALYETEPDFNTLPDAAAIAFEVIKPNLDASRRKSISGKKGGSKQQANSSKPEANLSKVEANLSKAEANRKQDKEQDKEQDKDKEQMLYPPTPFREAEKASEPDLSVLSYALQEKTRQWLAYKKERWESYKPVGLQALVNKIQLSAAQYGDGAVCELIDLSMSSGYQGILFDRLKKTGQKAACVGQNSPSDWSKDAVRRMMERAGEDGGA